MEGGRDRPVAPEGALCADTQQCRLGVTVELAEGEFPENQVTSQQPSEDQGEFISQWTAGLKHSPSGPELQGRVQEAGPPQHTDAGREKPKGVRVAVLAMPLSSLRVVRMLSSRARPVEGVKSRPQDEPRDQSPPSVTTGQVFCVLRT